MIKSMGNLWGVLKLLVRFRASGSNEPLPPAIVWIRMLMMSLSFWSVWQWFNEDDSDGKESEKWIQEKWIGKQIMDIVCFSFFYDAT